MDSAEIFKRYDAIIGGKFKRDAILADGKQSADEPDNLLNKDDKQKGPPVKVGVSSSRQEKTKDELDISQTTQWIPEVKRLVQFRDLRNQIQVLPAEKFSGRKRRIEKDIDHPWRGYAIILRRVLGADLSLREYRLELQSRSLCKIFKEIGRPYEELNLDTTPIVIKHPFLCLFHLRDQLKALKDSTNTDTATKQELSELLSFISMEPALKRIIEPYEELVPKGKIRRNLHWTLIRPHEFVYRRFGTGPETKHVYEECAFVTKVEEMFFVGPGSSYTHILHGVVTRHNGPTSGLTRCSWPFGSVSDAIVNITAKDLDCVPMRLLPREEQNDIRQRLIARGRRYFDLSSASHTFMKYDGPIILDPGENARRLGEIMGSRNIFNAHWVASQRVMIDRKAESEMCTFLTHENLISPCLNEFIADSSGVTDENYDEDGNATAMSDQDTPVGTSSDSDSSSDISAAQRRRRSRLIHNQRMRKLRMAWATSQFTDDDYLMCPPFVAAFLLLQKAWAEIFISGLTDIQWKDDPFVSLQLPQEKKTLVKSLVKSFGSESRGEDKYRYEDVIERKGRGLIFLLHGPPGLGKTLTAESVAESTRRPLYHASTGELSINVQQLEKQLSDIFRLGIRWGAVVLLDEADVLMTRRTTTELARNAIVAVFLRLIEYYDGMLFLTTNRLEDFDNAFYNRIHITIRYDTLKAPERTNIWRQHLTRASRRNNESQIAGGVSSSPEWSEEAYRLLGQIETNGRDIRNTTRTAYGYARALDEDLSIGHVLTVVRNNLDVDKHPDLPEILQRLEALEREGAERG